MIMPFFEKRKRRSAVGSGASNSPPPEPLPPPPQATQRTPEATLPQSNAAVLRHRQLIFHAQLAHGSPTKKIVEFSNVKELYQRIAEAFGIPSSEVSSLSMNNFINGFTIDTFVGNPVDL